MDYDLLMAIADAQARVINQYDVDIGPRTLLDLAASAYAAVERSLTGEVGSLGEQSFSTPPHGPVPHGTSEQAYTYADTVDAYNEGFASGRQFPASEWESENDVRARFGNAYDEGYEVGVRMSQADPEEILHAFLTLSNAPCGSFKDEDFQQGMRDGMQDGP